MYAFWHSPFMNVNYLNSTREKQNEWSEKAATTTKNIERKKLRKMRGARKKMMKINVYDNKQPWKISTVFKRNLRAWHSHSFNIRIYVQFFFHHSLKICIMCLGSVQTNVAIQQAFSIFYVLCVIMCVCVFHTAVVFFIFLFFFIEIKSDEKILTRFQCCCK